MLFRSPDASYEGDTVADADGNFSVTVVFDEEVPIGTYCYYIDDDDVLFNADVLPELDDLVVAAAVIEEEDDEPSSRLRVCRTPHPG